MAEGMNAGSATIKVVLNIDGALAQLAQLKQTIESTTGSLGAAMGGSASTTTGVPMPAKGPSRARGPRVPSVASTAAVSADTSFLDSADPFGGTFRSSVPTYSRAAQEKIVAALSSQYSVPQQAIWDALGLSNSVSMTLYNSPPSFPEEDQFTTQRVRFRRPGPMPSSGSTFYSRSSPDAAPWASNMGIGGPREPLLLQDPLSYRVTTVGVREQPQIGAGRGYTMRGQRLLSEGESEGTGTVYREADMRSATFIGGMGGSATSVGTEAEAAEAGRKLGGHFKMRYMWHAFTVAFLARMVGEGISSLIQSAGTASVDRSFLGNVGSGQLSNILRQKAYIQAHNSAFMNLISGKTYHIAQMAAEIPVEMAHIKAQNFYQQASGQMAMEGVTDPALKAMLSAQIKYESERTKIDQTPMSEWMRGSLLSQNRNAFLRVQYNMQNPYSQEEAAAGSVASATAAAGGFSTAAKIIDAQSKMADAINKTVAALHPFIRQLEQAQVGGIMRAAAFSNATFSSNYQGQMQAYGLALSGHPYKSALALKQLAVHDRILAFEASHPTNDAAQVAAIRSQISVNENEQASLRAKMAAEHTTAWSDEASLKYYMSKELATHRANEAARRHNAEIEGKVSGYSHAFFAATVGRKGFNDEFRKVSHPNWFTGLGGPALYWGAVGAAHAVGWSAGEIATMGDTLENVVPNTAKDRVKALHDQITTLDTQFAQHAAALNNLESKHAMYLKEIAAIDKQTGLNKYHLAEYAQSQGMSLNVWNRQQQIKKAQFDTSVAANLAIAGDLGGGYSAEMDAIRRKYAAKIKEIEEAAPQGGLTAIQKQEIETLHRQSAAAQSHHRLQHEMNMNMLAARVRISSIEAESGVPIRQRRIEEAKSIEMVTLKNIKLAEQAEKAADAAKHFAFNATKFNDERQIAINKFKAVKVSTAGGHRGISMSAESAMGLHGIDEPSAVYHGHASGGGIYNPDPARSDTGAAYLDHQKQIVQVLHSIESKISKGIGQLFN